MDARINITSRLPDRHVAGESVNVPRRSRDGAKGPTGVTLGAADVFKKTPYIAGLKLGGRDVAKDMVEVGIIAKTLLDHGHRHGDCMTGRTIAENVKSVKWNPNQRVVRPAEPTTVTGGAVGIGGTHADA